MGFNLAFKGLSKIWLSVHRISGNSKPPKGIMGISFASNSTQIRQEAWKVGLEIWKVRVEILLGFLVKYDSHWVHCNKTHAWSTTFDNGTCA